MIRDRLRRWLRNYALDILVVIVGVGLPVLLIYWALFH
jgi:hypothetical protein